MSTTMRKSQPSAPLAANPGQFNPHQDLSVPLAAAPAIEDPRREGTCCWSMETKGYPFYPANETYLNVYGASGPCELGDCGLQVCVCTAAPDACACDAGPITATSEGFCRQCVTY
jgi:hypothetical protein